MSFVERIGPTTTTVEVVTKNVITKVKSDGSVIEEKTVETVGSSPRSISKARRPNTLLSSGTLSDGYRSPILKLMGKLAASGAGVTASSSSPESSSNGLPPLALGSSLGGGALAFLTEHIQELKDLKEAVEQVLAEKPVVPSIIEPLGRTTSGFNISAAQSPLRSECAKAKSLLRPPGLASGKGGKDDDDDEDDDDDADEDDDDDDEEDDDSNVIYFDDESPASLASSSASNVGLASSSHAFIALQDITTWLSLKIDSTENFVKILKEAPSSSKGSSTASSSQPNSNRANARRSMMVLPSQSSRSSLIGSGSSIGSSRGNDEVNETSFSGDDDDQFFVDDDEDESLEELLYDNDTDDEDEEPKGEAVPSKEPEKEQTAPAAVWKSAAAPASSGSPPTEQSQSTPPVVPSITIPSSPTQWKPIHSPRRAHQYPAIPSFAPVEPPPSSTPAPAPAVGASLTANAPPSAVAPGGGTTALQWLLMNPSRRPAGSPISPRRGTLSRAAKAEMERELEIKAKQQRTNVFREILSTEREYVNSLQIVMEVYLRPIRESANSASQLPTSPSVTSPPSSNPSAVALSPNLSSPNASTAILTQDEIGLLFANIDEIYQVSRDLLAKFEELNKDILKDPQPEHFILLADAFVAAQAKLLRAYTPYVGNHQQAFTTYQQFVADKPAFAAFVKQAERNPKCKFMDLLGFLIKPVQRICKYPLLFKEMVKNSTRTEMEYESLLKAQRAAEAITNDVNELKRLSENMTKLIQVQSTLLGCGSFQLILPTRRLVREGTAIRVSHRVQKERRFILFNDILVSAKIDRSNPTLYTFEGKIDLAHILVNDIPDSSRKSSILPELKNVIEITPRTGGKKGKSVTVMFATPEEKASWLADLRNVKNNAPLAPLNLKTKGSEEVLRLVTNRQ